LAFKFKNGELTSSTEIEESIVQLCVTFPNTIAYIMSDRKLNVDTAILFYLGVTKETKDKYMQDSSTLGITLSNGSRLIFIGSEDLRNKNYPQKRSNILLAYGNVLDSYMKNLLASMKVYEDGENKKANVFLPMVITEDGVVCGDEAREIIEPYKNLGMEQTERRIEKFKTMTEILKEQRSENGREESVN
jgi:hypothetical protein